MGGRGGDGEERRGEERERKELEGKGRERGMGGRSGVGKRKWERCCKPRKCLGVIRLQAPPCRFFLD